MPLVLHIASYCATFIFQTRPNKSIHIDQTIAGEKAKPFGLVADENDYKEVEISLSVAELCTGIGIAISAATLVGVLIAASSNPLCIITVKKTMTAALTAAANLSIALGGLVNDHGITFMFHAYKDKVCRGSECFVGYYDYRYVDFTTY